MCTCIIKYEVPKISITPQQKGFYLRSSPPTPLKFPLSLISLIFWVYGNYLPPQDIPALSVGVCFLEHLIKLRQQKNTFLPLNQ